MLTSIAFAFVVATALLFLFRQTRWIGVVCVFVLLCIAPWFFAAVLLLLGIGYLLWFRKPSRGLYGDLPPFEGESARRSRRKLLLVGLIGIGGLLAIPSMRSLPGVDPVSLAKDVRSTPGEEVIVLRTPGGLLEVSRLYTTEILDARVTHKMLGLTIGELVPRIRVPAVYRYHVALAPEWHVTRKGDVFTVVAPEIRPSLPVAIESAGVEKEVSGTWLLLPWKGSTDLAKLERGLTEKLAERAASRDYIDRQRQQAKATVQEFARKWLVEQSLWKGVRYTNIQVRFEDEVVPAKERDSK